MLVSIGAYALLWGWKFGVGLVLLLLVHELGHVWQARREGLDASAPLFIPFLGAAIALKELPKDAAVEARVGLAGPIIGSLGACVPLAIWLATGEEFWQALAFFGFFLNLLNLAPVLPLDGGRAMAALTPWMWIVGYAMLVAATIAFPNPIMILILIFGGLETYRRWKERKSPDEQRFYARAPEHARRRGGHLHRPSASPRRRDGGHLPRAGLRRRVTGRAAPRGAPGCSRRTGRRAPPRPPGRPRARASSMKRCASGVLRISPSRIGPSVCVDARPMFSNAWLTTSFIAASCEGGSCASRSASSRTSVLEPLERHRAVDQADLRRLASRTAACRSARAPSPA